MNEIREAKKEWQKMNDEAKEIGQKMQYLYNKCEENTEAYKNLFKRLNKLSDQREEVNFKIERLIEARDKEHGYL